MKLQYFNLFIPLLFLSGCASQEYSQMRQKLAWVDNDSSKLVGASKITVQAKHRQDWIVNSKDMGNPNAYLYLNSEYQGYIDGRSEVSREVAPGTYTIGVCPHETKTDCVQQIINLKKNSHVTLLYTYTNEYRVLWLSNSWNLKVLKVENYDSKTLDNSSSDSNKSSNTVKNKSDSTIEQMDKAKEKCLSFGIKKDTEEFGKCVLDIYK